MNSVHRTAICGKRSRLGCIGWMLYRVCRGSGIGRPLVLTWPKWQMKLVRNLWPKLPGYVPRHVGTDADPGPFGDGAKAPFVAGMIQVTQGLGAAGSEPFGVIGHQVAGIAVGHKGVLQSVSEPLLEAAMSQAVIARVLLENCGIKKGIKKISCDVVQERRSISLSEARNTLSESGIIVGCLGQRRVPAGVQEIHRLEGVFHEQMEFSISAQCA